MFTRNKHNNNNSNNNNSNNNNSTTNTNEDEHNNNRRRKKGLGELVPVGSTWGYHFFFILLFLSLSRRDS